MKIDNLIESLQSEIDAQDQQLAEIMCAEAKFEETGDVDAIIDFWENLWGNGGLLFRGSHWAFRLADLYIACKDYPAAIKATKRIRAKECAEKKKRYLEKISLLVEKEKNRKRKQ